MMGGKVLVVLMEINGFFLKTVFILFFSFQDMVTQKNTVSIIFSDF